MALFTQNSEVLAQEVMVIIFTKYTGERQIICQWPLGCVVELKQKTGCLVQFRKYSIQDVMASSKLSISFGQIKSDAHII